MVEFTIFPALSIDSSVLILTRTVYPLTLFSTKGRDGLHYLRACRYACIVALAVNVAAGLCTPAERSDCVRTAAVRSRSLNAERFNTNLNERTLYHFFF